MHSHVCTDLSTHFRRGLFTAVLGGVWGTEEPPFHTSLPFAPTGLHPPTGIHCQPGPLKKTLEDFPRLVLERQPRLMLTRGMENSR